MFTNKDLKNLIIPLFLEQLLVMLAYLEEPYVPHKLVGMAESMLQASVPKKLVRLLFFKNVLTQCQDIAVIYIDTTSE